MLTITQNAMELVFREESKPVDTILLIFAELGGNRNRDFILLNLGPIQKLSEESSFRFTTSKKLRRETRWIR